ncbi:MAG: MCE family protein [Candidatus Gastranaerophilales bacterium]|nr:MCE family protein [Candidatus Gastranaerophilales bacterium]
MNKKKKYSSALKVGLLTLTAISILIFTVLWVKGRSLSGGERIDIAFKDVNGMRAGSAVQMMGLRIGQVEEIAPVIQGKDSYVKLRFVITEKGVKVPYASTISIQQSGIIGEQFLEVTPPKNEIMFNETTKSTTAIQKDQPIFMELSDGVAEIGKIVDAEVVKKSQIPFELRQKMNTNNVLKLVYTINLPGLILDKNTLGMKVQNGKISFYLLDGEILQTPKKGLKYTVIEPMRLSDFMDLGFRATHAMLETNDKITEILSDEFIGGIKTSVENISLLTQSANTTLDKAALLIDSSKTELEELTAQSQDLIKSLNTLSCNLNELISDETLKNDVVSSIKSVGKMSENINKILEDEQTATLMANIDETSRNLADISAYVNEYTKDEKLKEDITTTVTNLSSITTNLAKVMDDYNKLDDGEKLKLKSTVKDVLAITKNVKKFSEKLNKRFLLFRLMF